MIRNIEENDINSCAELLIAAYNCEPWNNNWTLETAQRYLTEFFRSEKFLGFVSIEQSEVTGAIFAHRKTWWTNDEIYVDELYIKPNEQGKGYGTQLLKKIEQYSIEEGLGGVTLLTNRYFPSAGFYNKRGYSIADHVIFMYKQTT